ncbi:MAG: hypothetical protein JRN20_19300, partial [Nitrososphaerota archaeon]|nr:hypothetical protein [Nitrososphaerota archaeon]
HLISLLNSIIPGGNVPENDSGTPWNFSGFLLSLHGNLNIATFTSSGGTTGFGTGADLESLAGAVSSLVLCLVKGCSKVGPITGASPEGANYVKAIISVLSNAAGTYGDFTALSIPSLSSGGQHQGSPIVDFLTGKGLARILSWVSTLVTFVMSATKVVYDVLAILASEATGVNFWIGAVTDALSLLANGFDLGCKIYLAAKQESSDSFCTVVHDIKDFTTVLSGIVSWITASDPNGTVLYPSYYDGSGALVLGYDPNTGRMITNSTAGLLLGNDQSWYAYLGESNGARANYTLVLRAVGSIPGEAIPYTVMNSFNYSQGIYSLSGSITTGEQASVELSIAPNGSKLIIPTFLVPRVTVVGIQNNYTVFVMPYLDNGSLAESSSASLTLANGTEYNMTAIENGRLAVNIVHDYNTTSSFAVDVLGQGLPGGFSENALTAATRRITFNETGLPKGTAWSVSLNGTSLSSTSSSISFAISGNSTFSYSIQSESGYYANYPVGNISLYGSSAQQEIVFGQSPETSTSTNSPHEGATSPSLELILILAAIALIAAVGFLLLRRRRK